MRTHIVILNLLIFTIGSFQDESFALDTNDKFKYTCQQTRAQESHSAMNSLKFAFDPISEMLTSNFLFQVAEKAQTGLTGLSPVMNIGPTVASPLHMNTDWSIEDLRQYGWSSIKVMYDLAIRSSQESTKEPALGAPTQTPPKYWPEAVFYEYKNSDLETDEIGSPIGIINEVLSFGSLSYDFHLAIPEKPLHAGENQFSMQLFFNFSFMQQSDMDNITQKSINYFELTCFRDGQSQEEGQSAAVAAGQTTDASQSTDHEENPELDRESLSPHQILSLQSIWQASSNETKGQLSHQIKKVFLYGAGAGIVAKALTTAKSLARLMPVAGGLFAFAGAAHSSKSTHPECASPTLVGNLANMDSEDLLNCIQSSSQMMKEALIFYDLIRISKSKGLINSKKWLVTHE